MPSPAAFKQADVTRAVKGFRAAGMEVGAARIERDGTITILTLKGGETGKGPDPDQLLK